MEYNNVESFRKIWIDILKLVALMGVITIHVVSERWRTVLPDSFDGIILNFLNGISRFCVPIFVMCSGCFFCNPERKQLLEKLYKKYCFRLLLAYLFFSMFYALYPAVFQMRSGETVEIGKIISDVYEGAYHLWYIPMLLGLYILVPVFRCIVTDKNVTRYLVSLLFVLSILLPTLEQYAHINFFSLLCAKLDYNDSIKYSVYFILGYVLDQQCCSQNSRKIIYILGIIGTIITIVGNQLISHDSGKMTEMMFSYLSLNVFFSSIALFIYFRRRIAFTKMPDTIKKFVEKTSSFVFGIYLVHPFVINIMLKIGFMKENFSAMITPVLVIIVFGVSYLLTQILKKIPLLKEIL